MFSAQYEGLFQEFLRERRYLKNISKNTERFYNQSWTAYKTYAPGGLAIEFSKGQLTKWVMAMREAEIKPKSCNTFISAINAFVHWLYDNEVIPKRIGAELLKIEEEEFTTLNDKQLRQLADYKPKTKGEWRTHTILSLLIDTGMRIDEALSSQISGIDFEQSLITIKGKGSKTRTIPISYEMKKRLWNWIKKEGIIPLLIFSQLQHITEWIITTTEEICSSCARKSGLKTFGFTRTVSGIISRSTLSKEAATYTGSLKSWDTRTFRLQRFI